MSNKITATVPAWLTPGAIMPNAGTSAERAISDFVLWYPFNKDGTGPEGWTKVGMAEITVTLDDMGEITKSQINVLKETKKRVQAEAQQRINAIDDQISKLSCLEYKP